MVKRSNSSDNDRNDKKLRRSSRLGQQQRVTTMAVPGLAKCLISEPKHSFDDLAGIDDIIESLNFRVVGPFVQPNLAAGLEVEVPRGVLLTGKPGVGKTVLAEAIVYHINQFSNKDVKFYSHTTQCMSKWEGEAEGNIRQLFLTAHQSAPSVIFLDEIDGFGVNRSNCQNSPSRASMVTTILDEMNRVIRGSVLVIAATNHPELCDPALLRKGRFDQTYKLELPNEEARENILNFYFAKKQLKVSNGLVQTILQQSNGFTGSDLQSLVSSIQIHALKRAFPNEFWFIQMAQGDVTKCAKKMRGITKDDVNEALMTFNKEKEKAEPRNPAAVLAQRSV